MRSGNSGNRVFRRSSHNTGTSDTFRCSLGEDPPACLLESLDHRSREKRLPEKQRRDASTCDEQLCADACQYTTLTYRRTYADPSASQAFRVYMDFQHDGLSHATWKETVEEEQARVNKTLTSSVKPARVETIHPTSQWVYPRDTRRPRSEQDDLFALDTAPYPNRPMPMSRRPRDALHIDFHQTTRFQGSKVEATCKTFFHRKYLVRAFRRISIT